MKKNDSIVSPRAAIQRARSVPTGARIGVVAPGAAVDAEKFSAGLDALRARGFDVVVPIDPTTNFGRADRGFGSSSPQARVDALHSLLRDDSVGAILTARGGYGTAQILPLVDFDLIAQSRKLLVGYSDITALLVNIAVRSHLPAIHGAFVGGEFSRERDDPDARASVESLLSLIGNRDTRVRCAAHELRAGRGEGWLLAGNLTLLQTLLGTPWDVSYDGAILVLEEVAEFPYRIHRALTQLLYAGKFKRLQGLCFGRFTRCTAPSGPTIEKLLRDFVAEELGDVTYPVLTDLEVGHEGPNLALPLGCWARVSDGVLELDESPIE